VLATSPSTRFSPVCYLSFLARHPAFFFPSDRFFFPVFYPGHLWDRRWAVHLTSEVLSSNVPPFTISREQNSFPGRSTVRAPRHPRVRFFFFFASRWEGGSLGTFKWPRFSPQRPSLPPSARLRLREHVRGKKDLDRLRLDRLGVPVFACSRLGGQEGAPFGGCQMSKSVLVLLPRPPFWFSMGGLRAFFALTHMVEQAAPNFFSRPASSPGRVKVNIAGRLLRKIWRFVSPLPASPSHPPGT